MSRLQCIERALGRLRFGTVRRDLQDLLPRLGGAVEILFADGSTLQLDVQSAVDFQSDELIRLRVGRVRLIIPGPIATNRASGGHTSRRRAARASFASS